MGDKTKLEKAFSSPTFNTHNRKFENAALSLLYLPSAGRDSSKTIAQHGQFLGTRRRRWGAVGCVNCG